MQTSAQQTTPLERFQTSVSGSGSDQLPSKKITRISTIRIGEWPLRGSSRLSTRQIALEAQNNPRRTETDIQSEEEDIGSLRPRSSQLNSPVEGHGSPPTNAVTNELVEQEIDLIDAFDYYRFDWYWMLMKMAVAALCMLIINFLAQSGNIVINGRAVLTVVAYILGQCFCYTATFVTLTKHHSVLERTFQTYLHVNPEWIGNILRYGAHFVFPLSLAGALTLYLMIWYNGYWG